MSSAGALPELAGVHWRPLIDERRLRRAAQLWTLTTVAHVVPFIAIGVLLLALNPLSAPVAAVSIIHAWIIPRLYAQRGANVVRRRTTSEDGPEQAALGLLGDLVDERARTLHADTGLIIEPGRLGTWLVAEAGALLVRPGGRRVFCWCVRADHPGLPHGDRVAHLLLALRFDEAGFATVANMTFSGAAWRVRGRLPAAMRPALDQARTRHLVHSSA